MFKYLIKNLIKKLKEKRIRKCLEKSGYIEDNIYLNKIRFDD